ncbi:cytochrome P450 [Streptomyces sp. SID8382]|uniref:cytochrome P450 n=1 Tax=Streptomyces malaysiensis TaxID=92644 RepID=UPI000C2C2793|nr:cytochrome P450 [Streptomyces sp. M56]AUA16127.1 Cytochrome P450-SU2 [Streptomyces sp. M56]MYX58260.1 cytochrome P450 [Streptomyces sp. SID8382]
MSVTSRASTPSALPRHRGCPFDPPSAYTELREEGGASRLAFPDGNVGWLLTRHEDVSQLLADDRFSSDRRRTSSPVHSFPVRPDDRRMLGSFIGMDPPEHTRYRRLLSKWFTARGMRGLQPRIEEIVEDHLAAMERAGPPADLVTSFAQPIPSLVICELLGVPYEDRTDFQRWATVLLRLGQSQQEVYAARDALWDYMRGLIDAKRHRPDEALLSRLVNGDQGAPGGPGTATAAGLTDDELTGVGLLLLVAGHETTANMLALGTYALLRHPEQARMVRERPEVIDHAVEELLRYLTIVQFGTVRVAREDLEIAGVRVRAGETVVGSLASANRDSSRFPDPDTLDVTRDTPDQMAFGHGIHQCLGQHLARMEMRTGYPALLRRFPTLRLAVEPDQVPLRHDMLVYGVHRLPVTWDRAAG